jgi:hypothetical protein
VLLRQALQGQVHWNWVCLGMERQTPEKQHDEIARLDRERGAGLVPEA